VTTKTAERRRTNTVPQGIDETRFLGIFARTGVGVALVDRCGRVLESNSALQRMMGYAGHELNGKKFYELVQSSEIDSIVASFSRILINPPQEVQIESRFVQKDEREMWGRLTISPLRSGESDSVWAAVILEDISERKRTEEALLFSEFKFRTLFESNIAPFAFWHADGRVLDANDAYLTLTGSSLAEMQAGRLRWDILTPPEYRQMDEQAREALTLGRQAPIIYEKELLLSDGRRVPVIVSLSLLPGYRDRGFGCIVDLTQQKLALKRSEENRALIKAVFSSLTGYVAVIDGAGNVLTVNEAWMQFVRESDGHPFAAGVCTNYFDMCRLAIKKGDSNAEKVLSGITSVLSGERAEYRMEYANGKRWLEMIVQPLRRIEGGAVISHIDITDRHQAEIEARDMRLELSHVTRVAMMGELTASLAHELSQPLTAILANAQTAQRLLALPVPAVPELREILDDIVTDEQRAAETIRRVRRLMKKDVPEHQLLDLNAAIVEVLGFINTEALTKNVVVSTQLKPCLPNVKGDRIQLQQVVLNLVLNALDAMKDMPVGERRLEVASFLVDNAMLQVSVYDTGIGIAPEVLEKMFNPFFTAKPDGLGMGLAICRSIVEAHGGRIWATNNAGHGAVFRFTLPTNV
jgi:PAS domain S-box-containing protein